ncbi:MAG: acyl-CoA dehydrogenase family protein [Anaerolineales bacterium]
MPSFEPSSEQKMLIEAASRLAEEVFRPGAAEAESNGTLAPSTIEKGWSLGLLATGLPLEVGGLGERSALSGVLAVEELARGDLSAALATLAPSAFALPIVMAGTPDQRRKYLPRFAGANWPASTAAVIEPTYNFDFAFPEVRAHREAAEFVLTGVKGWVPFADRAQDLLVYASEGDRVQAFIVPRSAPGVMVQDREKLMGLDAIPLYRVTFRDVRLEAAARLGGEAGIEHEPILAAARVATSALGLGLARAAYEYALRYAQDRRAFGAPIGQKQAVAFMLAEMATEIEAIRLLVWEAAWRIDRGEAAGRAAHLAHLGAADMAMMVADRAVQVLGGHGYVRDHPVERWLREARSLSSLTGIAMV